MENEKPKMTKVASAATFLVGTAVGATLGVLYAPHSGEQNRRKLGEWIKEKREKGKTKLAGMRRHDRILAEV